MSHSVQRHLEVSPEAYDAEIRRFVPSYAAMLEEIAGAVAELLPGGAGPLLDLGCGTGALAASLAAHFPAARFTLLDADPQMLARARARLAAHAARIDFRQGSFADPLPRCRVAVASLSLHHVHDRAAKVSVYRNVLAALEPGGALVNGDAYVSAARAVAEPLMRRWASHLVAHGDTEAQAFERFAQWSLEDRYFGVDEELAMLAEAGFGDREVRWRQGPIGVIVARREP